MGSLLLHLCGSTLELETIGFDWKAIISRDKRVCFLCQLSAELGTFPSLIIG